MSNNRRYLWKTVTKKNHAGGNAIFFYMFVYLRPKIQIFGYPSYDKWSAKNGKNHLQILWISGY